MTWGDKMTKAEIDDIFGEFEIDEDYMIKSKMLSAYLLPLRKNLKPKNLPLHLLRKPQQRKMKARPRRRKRRRRRLPSKWQFPLIYPLHWVGDARPEKG